MSHYPKMLYRRALIATDGTVDVHGSPFGTRVVADADDEAVAGSEGWAEYGEVSSAMRPAPATDIFEAEQEDGSDADDHKAVAETLRDELLAADDKLKAKDEQIADTEQALASANGTISTLRTEVSLANDRIATLQTENAELTEKLATLDADGDGSPGGSLPQDPPSLSGKTKADLLAIAEAEGVTIEDGALNADIIAAIELKREAGAA